MKISAVLASAAFGVSMIVAGSAFAGASGKVDAVEKDGRSVTIAGKKIGLGNSGTKITIAGKPAKRGDIKAGMDCMADVDKGRAKVVTCK
ncbi:MAG: hypothetical protein RL477_945 [Pseudomonadota bacterium]|jgi:hypothetical protein